MSGTKDTTATNSTQSAPWAAAQPALNTVLQGAMNTFQAGQGNPFSASTLHGFGGSERVANESVPALQQNFDTVARNNADLASRGGLNALQQQAVGGFQGIADHPLNDIQNRSLGYLDKIAAGGEMSGNPFLEDIIGKSSRNMQDAVNLQASGMGRTGSGANQDVLSRNIGDMTSGLRYQDFGNQQARRDAAITGVGQMGNQAYNQQSNALGSVYNAGQQGINNLWNGGQALTGAYNARMMPEQTMLDIGAMKEAGPWADLQRLFGLASGVGGMGGTSGGSATTPGPSRLGSGIGGAMAGYDMFGGPLGGILGGLGGAFL